jgi:hypothetical protein
MFVRYGKKLLLTNCIVYVYPKKYSCCGANGDRYEFCNRLRQEKTLWRLPQIFLHHGDK